ncbi:MAG: hypothetical protein QOF61_1087 [Acidobacteriota bacterium]|jgi:hypothetical protein|nr:hypothetical protein [Acidobacteriota bacterium]
MLLIQVCLITYTLKEDQEMGFFSKLKKVVAGVDKGAAIAASTLPGKSGQIAGDVAQGAGVVTAVVQQIQSKPASEVPPAEAQKQATLATAVAVDDHEERLAQIEKLIQGLQAQKSGQAGTQ